MSQGKAAYVEPSIDTIEASQTLPDLIGPARLDRLPPHGGRVREVIWMNLVSGPPMFQILERLAEVFQGRLVDAFDFPSRGHDGNRGRNAVHDQTEIQLRILSPVFRNFIAWCVVGTGGGVVHVFLPTC